MKRTFPGNRLTHYLLLVCFLLAGIILLERNNLMRQGPIEFRPESVPADIRQILPPRATYVSPDIKTFTEIIERPLFIAGREPPAQPDTAQVTPAAKQAPLRLQLEGLAITNETRVAVVRDLGNKELFTLEEGMKHQDWLLKSVSSSGATFTHGQQTRELTLEIDKISQRSGKPGNRQGVPPAVAGGRVTLDMIRIKKSQRTTNHPVPIQAHKENKTPDNHAHGKPAIPVTAPQIP